LSQIIANLLTDSEECFWIHVYGTVLSKHVNMIWNRAISISSGLKGRHDMT